MRSVLITVMLAGLCAGLDRPALANETGRPFLTTYTPKAYGGHSQNWDMLQDDRSILYVANSSGVLEFDGASWRIVESTGGHTIRCLAIDEAGRIYVGGGSGLGYLAPDETGQLGFVSLVEQIPEEKRAFNEIWTVRATPQGIYFQARERLFRFRLAQSDDPSNLLESWDVKSWEPDEGGRFGYTFQVGDAFYIHQLGTGLMQMEGDALKLLPGGGQFANERLQVMLPYDSSGGGLQLLVGPFNRGLFLYDGRSFRRFETEADEHLIENTLYKGEVLSDGTFGLTTLGGGFVVIDDAGRLRLHLDQSSGLPTNVVTSVYVDRQNSVWLGTGNGISQVDTPSPLTSFGAGEGIQSGISDIRRHQGVLYLATNAGVLYLDDKDSIFRPVTGLATGSPQSFSLLSLEDGLLAAVGSGLHRIKGSRASVIKKNVGVSFRPAVLYQSELNPRRIYVGLNDGLESFIYSKGQWTSEGRTPGLHEEVRTIVETKEGDLWLASAGMTARLTFPRKADGEPDLAQPTIERFGTEHGLSSGWRYVYSLHGRLVLSTDSDGVLSYDEQSRRFLPDPTFDVSFSDGFRGVDILAEDSKGNVWFGSEQAGEVVVAVPQPDGEYEIEKTPFKNISKAAIVSIYADPDGVVWFGGDGLFRYDSQIQRDYTADFPALIRRVTVNDESVIFAGFGSLEATASEFEYSRNALRIDYSAASFQNPSENQFQSFLEGFDSHWSSWTHETKRNYTNLPQGSYQFRVKARNIYDHESEEAVYPFEILPPWYQTVWAYLFYGFAFLGAVFVTDRFQRRRLILKERQRGQLREAELRAQAAEAEAKTLQTENERKKNVEMLSEIGRDITATLSIEQIINTAYENVNTLMDAAVFGIGIYDREEEIIHFPGTKEKGESLPPYSFSVDDDDRLAVWSFKNQSEVVINDYWREHQRYVTQDQPAVAGDDPESILYLPLTYKDQRMGVITAQSFSKNVYTEYHLNILRNLATYTAIALDNAEAYRQLNKTLDHLRATQEQLVVQEKLASLGALTAGIAHEIKNPLNFIMNFSDLSVELVDELREEMAKVDGFDVNGEMGALLDDLQTNATKVREHGKRADGIVRSMLAHSRGSSNDRRPTEVNALLEEYVNLAYHGKRAQDVNFNATIERDYDENVGKAQMIPQEIGRVLINLLGNAFDALRQRQERANGDYQPQVSVGTRKLEDRVEVWIKDNGGGIPEDLRDKIFQPFFTTKATGSGTGLGLSLSYEIVVQGHGGDLRVENHPGQGATFVMALPI